MNTAQIKKSLKSYFSVFKIRLISALQYRAAALAGLTTNFFWGFMLIMIFEAFYASGAPQEFSFEKLVSYIWLQQAFLSFFMAWYSDRELGQIIVSGNISYELVRPHSIYSFWYAKLFGGKLASGLLRFPIVITVAFLLPAPYNLSLPPDAASFVLFMTGLILGIFLTTCISMLMYISMFKTHTLIGSIILFSITTDFLSGHYIPVPLMPDWLQKAASFLPFRYATDLPFRIYSGDIAGAEAISGILIEIFWIALLFTLGSLLMKAASKKVVAYGG